MLTCARWSKLCASVYERNQILTSSKLLHLLTNILVLQHLSNLSIFLPEIYVYLKRF